MEADRFNADSFNADAAKYQAVAVAVSCGQRLARF